MTRVARRKQFLRRLGQRHHPMVSGGRHRTRDSRQKREKNYDFNIVRCKYAEHVQRARPRGYGFHLLRARRHVQRLQRENKLERTQTIMQGADYCDFRLSIDEEAVSDEKG